MARPKVFDVPEVVVEPPRPAPAAVPAGKALQAETMAPDPGWDAPMALPPQTADRTAPGLPPAFQHATATAARATTLRTLQHQRGNGYVQKLLSRKPSGETTPLETAVDPAAGAGWSDDTHAHHHAVAPEMPLPPAAATTVQETKAETDRQQAAVAAREKAEAAASAEAQRAAGAAAPLGPAAVAPAVEAGRSKKEAAASVRSQAAREAAAPDEAIHKPGTPLVGKKPVAGKTPPASDVAAPSAKADSTPGAAPPEAELEAKAAARHFRIRSGRIKMPLSASKKNGGKPEPGRPRT